MRSSTNFRLGRRWPIISVLVVAILVVVVVAIVVATDQESEPTWEPHPIESFEGAPADLLYTVGIHCYPEARTTVEESPGDVVVSLEVRGDSEGDCTNLEIVTLDEPVGQRRVIDAFTGTDVPSVVP